MRKYGIDNFGMYKIETFNTLQECNDSEEYYISFLKTQDRNEGYNIEAGGNNKIMTQETKDKLSKIFSERFLGEGNPFYGKHHSEETKQRLSEIRTGSIMSKETKEKMSKVKMGENNSMFGKKHSENSLKKMSEAQIGKHVGEKNHMFGMTGEKSPNYGKERSKETKEKISKANKNKTKSEEAKKKMSDAKKGKKMTEETKEKISKATSGENNPMFGKKHSEEIRKKISEAVAGKLVGELNPFYGKKHTEESKKKPWSQERKLQIKRKLTNFLKRAQKIPLDSPISMRPLVLIVPLSPLAPVSASCSILTIPSPEISCPVPPGPPPKCLIPNSPPTATEALLPPLRMLNMVSASQSIFSVIIHSPAFKV
jgi:hypothetical protein